MYVMIASFFLHIISASCNYYEEHHPISVPIRNQYYKGKNNNNQLINYHVIRNRYHPSTFSVSEDEHQAQNSENQFQFTTFTNGDTHEGEVMMHQLQQEHIPASTNNNNNNVFITSDHYQPYRPNENQEVSGGYPSHNPAPYPAPSPPPAPYPPAPTVGPYSHPYPPPLPPAPPHKSKDAPYTYYYLSRHLWYIPLYFSIYFIVYVGLLVLKSIAIHKIQFPQNLHEAASTREQHILRSIEIAKQRYFM